MHSDVSKQPVVMAIAGNDPTGGAGLAADTESIISQGCYAMPVATCITVQDTCDVHSVNPIDADLVIQQARTILEDIAVDAIKIGLLGNEENIEAVHEIIADYPNIPVVLDPIMTAGGGSPLSNDVMLEMFIELLLPYTTVLTPNSHEALALVPGADSIQAAALALQESGCQYILVTGTHENSPQVINRLYGEQKELYNYRWDRLPHSYHGSGCTLSASLTALLAHGLSPAEAVYQAQEFTWYSLYNGHRLGMGQHHPNRLFWANEDGEPDTDTESDIDHQQITHAVSDD